VECSRGAREKNVLNKFDITPQFFIGFVLPFFFRARTRRDEEKKEQQPDRASGALTI
jgi:hypothetical protein